MEPDLLTDFLQLRYAWRSFDRQWVLPDNRFCDRPRPDLWAAHGERQVYLTSHLAGVLGIGPASMITANVPDLHYFCGRGGKDVIPLWRDAEATQANLPDGLLAALNPKLGEVTPEDFFAYCYALLATPAYRLYLEWQRPSAIIFQAKTALTPDKSANHH